MALWSTPPFELGQTLTGTDPSGTLVNTDKVGLKYWLPDIRMTGDIRGQKSLRSNAPIYAMICRNTSGITLYGKRLGVFEQATDGNKFLHHVNGYAATLRQSGIIAIDEYIATVGVANNDLFWGILCGPTTLLTANAGADFPADIAQYGRLVAGTGAGTTTSLAGRIASLTLSSATDAIQTPLVGWALTARTTGNTGSEVYVKMTLGFHQ